MANYRRLISYIYAYEGDIKGKNIGFVKLESRNGQCRLSINVKKVYVGGSDLGVYLLAPGKEISLGTIFIRGGAGEFRTSVAVDNAADSGVSMEECYGLSIHEPTDSWRSYQTIWEDAVAHAAQLELEEAVPQNSMNEAEVHKQAREIAAKLDQEIEENAAGESPQDQDAPEDVPGNQNTPPAAQPSAEPLYSLEPVTPVSQEPVNPASQGSVTSVIQGAIPLADQPVPPVSQEPITSVSRKPEEARESGEAAPAPLPVQDEAAKAGSKAQNPPQVSMANQPISLPAGSSVARDISASPHPVPFRTMDGRRSLLREELRENRIAGRPFGDGPFQRAREAQRISRPQGAIPRPAALETSPAAPVAPATSAPLESAPAAPATSAPLESAPAAPATSAPLESAPAASAPQESTPAASAVYTPQASAPLESAPATPATSVPTESAPAASEPQQLDRGQEDLILGDPRILEQLEQEEKAAVKPGQLWEMFRKRWPKIQAFDCAGGCEILTIKPQDIGLMPREIWTYGNNSFLLHGYYNYRYLILAKVADPNRDGSRYILGVPGNYYSNEKYMASMFGFPHFVLAKRQNTPGGRFGYWYTDVRLDHMGS